MSVAHPPVRRPPTRRFPPSLATALGRRLRALRKAQRLTIGALSQASGVDPATISRMENGKMIGRLDAHTKLATALGIDLPMLFLDVPTASPLLSTQSVLLARLRRLLHDRSDQDLRLALALLEAAFRWVGTSHPANATGGRAIAAKGRRSAPAAAALRRQEQG